MLRLPAGHGVVSPDRVAGVIVELVVVEGSNRFMSKNRLFTSFSMSMAAAGVIFCLASAAMAADVSTYGVLKGQKCLQFGDMAPFELQYEVAAVVLMSGPNSVTEATVLAPSAASTDSLGDRPTARVLEYRTTFDSKAELDAAYPEGAYLLTTTGASDGVKALTLTLTGGTYPSVPTVTNYTATQGVNPSAPFILGWKAFTGGTANDAIVVVVKDLMTDTVVFSTPSAGLAGALDGRATSVTIPANSLPANNSLLATTVTFVKVTLRDSTSYAGAVGIAGYYKETSLNIQTTAGTGTGDTTKPTLVSSDPSDGDVDVPTSTVISFTFSEAMGTGYSIAWSANVAAANFTYSWSADAKTLECTYAGGLPANKAIAWNLNPAGAALFKDVAGNALAADTFSGSFTTAGGGTVDVTPPALLTVDPMSYSIAVPVNKVIRFTFSEAMAPTYSIAWSANLSASSFTYTWSAPNTLLCAPVGNLPANALITWKLNPTGSALFKDLAGNVMPAEIFTGSFTTGGSGGGTNDPCNPNMADTGLGSFGLSKQLTFVQSDNGAPTPDPTQPATGSAFLNSPTNNPVTSAILQYPGGSDHPLANLFGRVFGGSDSFASQAALDSAMPGGAYVLKLTRQNGSKPTATLNFPANPYPPTPQILNLVQAQAIDAAAAFEIRWNGIPNPTQNDGIVLTISKGTFTFVVPDYCANRPLTNTATSYVIPKGTLAAATTFDATLSYNRSLAMDTNSLSDVALFANAQTEVHFTIKTTGGSTQPTPPKFTGFRFLANGHFQLEITGEAGRTYALDTCGDLVGWTLIKTVVAGADGKALIEDDRVPLPSKSFYRARVSQ